MNPEYVSALGNHLWQSTLFAGLAGFLTLALRNNRARVRHGVWLAASCKFLIPFSVLIALGGHVRWRAETTQSNIAIVMDQVSQPFTAPTITARRVAPPRTASPLPEILLAGWAIGFLGISGAWWIRWRRIRDAVHAGSHLQLEIPIRAVSSPTSLEPGVFGVLRPVLLLPEGMFDRLTPPQVEAIIAHELCHVRHRDNLAAALHMLVETVFWFHPLVWWVGKQIVEERERACDEEVLLLGSEPRVYAEGILNVCKCYLESPLACVSGVTGANLRRRIEAIMSNRAVQALNRAKKILLVSAGVAAVVGPLGLGIVRAHALGTHTRAVIEPTREQAPAVPTITEQGPAGAAPAGAPTKMASTQAAKPQQNRVAPSSTEKPPVFDAVSVKPDTTALMGGREVPGVGGGRLRFSPGRVLGTNVSTRRIIIEAYRLTDFQLSSGGPGWLDSARFDIEGKSETATNENQLRQMLQTMLVDRFKLGAHRENKQMAVYTLMVGKTGPTLTEWKQGEPMPKLPHPEGEIAGAMTTRGTVQQLAEELSRNPIVGRPVLDMTGIQGTYLFQVGWGPDSDIMTAVQQQLGLRFESEKAPMDTLVIDHIEKPDGN